MMGRSGHEDCSSLKVMEWYERLRKNMIVSSHLLTPKIYNLGPGQASNFTCAEPNANE